MDGQSPCQASEGYTTQKNQTEQCQEKGGRFRHAMRHTFGTWLSKGGVAPRTAQSAMRHSNIDLTMQVYTDPKLLDVLGAIDSLPQLPLVDNTEVMVQASMGTDDVPSQRHGPKFAPGFALNPHNRGQSIATQDKCSELDDSIQESKKARNQCDLQDFSQSGRLDLNQRPLRPERSALPG